jgi:electron transport complex protein RnfG
LTFPCNLAFDADGNFQGAAVKTSEGGFGGKIDMMVGFAADGTIKGTSVLSHAETPGLGANMTGKFKDQFVDKNPADFRLIVTKDGGDVDAITAATITSRAFSKAVDKAYQAFEANKAQFMNNAPVEEETPAEEEVPAEENNETEGGQSNE